MRRANAVTSIVALLLGPLLLACSPLLSAETTGERERAGAGKPADAVVRDWLVDVTGGRNLKKVAQCTKHDDLLAGRPRTRPHDPSDGPSPAPRWRQVREVATAVEEVRGHRFRRKVRPKFLAPKDFTYRFADPLLSWTVSDGFALQGRLLSALGAAPSSVDLQRISHRATSKGLEGLYIPATEKLLVRTSNEGRLSARTRFVLAHELNHALVHQRFPLALDGPSPQDQDAALARRALVEGDATLTMYRYASRALSTRDRLSLLRTRAQSHTPTDDLRELPHYLQRQGSFPYDRGLEFVCDLVAHGGWQAVDHAHRNPPSDSAQILFPARYRAGEDGADPRDPPPLPSPWGLVSAGPFGAANLLWLFEAPSADVSRALPDPLGRASAWAGGELRMWVKGRGTAVAVALLQKPGQPSLCRSIAKWYRSSFPGAKKAHQRRGEALAVNGTLQDAVLSCSGREVRLGIAPSLAIARAAVR